ncbi:uncharacterized protein LOC136078285 [Hydra vulgaris]|uniref:Uncharacterized protein LOC136078285 n=1 Tax=Hydra vulgaris TaxID=6087 RepID=A0ABM4BL94_HYDVU
MSFHNVTSFPNIIWMCLQSTGKALHEMVVYTYQQQDPVAKKKFFLVGYKGSRWGSRWGKHKMKLYDNPSKSNSGLNIKWILRNILWHKKMYANYLRLYEDSLKEIVDFLLVDIFEDSFADLNIEINNIELLISDCFGACLELVTAMLESEYYSSLSKTVAKVKSDIETQLLCLKFDEVVFANKIFCTQKGAVLQGIECFLPQIETDKNTDVANSILSSISFRSDCQVNYVVEDENKFVDSNIGAGLVFIDQVQTDPSVSIIKNFLESSTDSFIFSDKEDSDHIEETYVLV